MALAELSHNVKLSILWKLHIQIVHIWYENKCVFVYPRKLYLGQFVSMCRLHADKSPSTQWPFRWSHAHAHLPIQRFTIGRYYAMLPNHRPVKMFRHSHWLKSHDLWQTWIFAFYNANYKTIPEKQQMFLNKLLCCLYNDQGFCWHDILPHIPICLYYQLKLFTNTCSALHDNLIIQNMLLISKTNTTHCL